MGCRLHMLMFGASGPGGRSGLRALHEPGSVGMESAGLADACWAGGASWAATAAGLTPFDLGLIQAA
ncbi:unnamed protein product [Prunus armeniaca]